MISLMAWGMSLTHALRGELGGSPLLTGVPPVSGPIGGVAHLQPDRPPWATNWGVPLGLRRIGGGYAEG